MRQRHSLGDNLPFAPIHPGEMLSDELQARGISQRKFASNRIYELMQEREPSMLRLAQTLGKRPSEVTKWLSGQHNFTMRTVALLSAFFGEALINVGK